MYNPSDNSPGLPVITYFGVHSYSLPSLSNDCVLVRWWTYTGSFDHLVVDICKYPQYIYNHVVYHPIFSLPVTQLAYSINVTQTSLSLEILHKLLVSYAITHAVFFMTLKFL